MVITYSHVNQRIEQMAAQNCTVSGMGIYKQQGNTGAHGSQAEYSEASTPCMPLLPKPANEPDSCKLVQ